MVPLALFRYASSEFMTTDDLLIFLEAEQGVSMIDVVMVMKTDEPRVLTESHPSQMRMMR